MRDGAGDRGLMHGSAGRSTPAATFPPRLSALKCVYRAIMSLDPTGRGRQRWSNRWKEVLNAFEITFDGRLSTNRCQRRPKIDPLSAGGPVDTGSVFRRRRQSEVK